MTKAKRISTVGPATQPSCAIAHANDNTPDPITAVIICDDVVQKFPATTSVSTMNSTNYFFQQQIKERVWLLYIYMKITSQVKA